jgi:hypothetical protein
MVNITWSLYHARIRHVNYLLSFEKWLTEDPSQMDHFTSQVSTFLLLLLLLLLLLFVTASLILSTDLMCSCVCICCSLRFYLSFMQGICTILMATAELTVSLPQLLKCISEVIIRRGAASFTFSEQCMILWSNMINHVHPIFPTSLSMEALTIIVDGIVKNWSQFKNDRRCRSQLHQCFLVMELTTDLPMRSLRDRIPGEMLLECQRTFGDHHQITDSKAQRQVYDTLVAISERPNWPYEAPIYEYKDIKDTRSYSLDIALFPKEGAKDSEGKLFHPVAVEIDGYDHFDASHTISLGSTNLKRYTLRRLPNEWRFISLHTGTTNQDSDTKSTTSTTTSGNTDVYGRGWNHVSQSDDRFLLLEQLFAYVHGHGFAGPKETSQIIGLLRQDRSTAQEVKPPSVVRRTKQQEQKQLKQQKHQELLQRQKQQKQNVHAAQKDHGSKQKKQQKGTDVVKKPAATTTTTAAAVRA